MKFGLPKRDNLELIAEKILAAASFYNFFEAQAIFLLAYLDYR